MEDEKGAKASVLKPEDPKIGITNTEQHRGFSISGTGEFIMGALQALTERLGQSSKGKDVVDLVPPETSTNSSEKPKS